MNFMCFLFVCVLSVCTCYWFGSPSSLNANKQYDSLVFFSSNAKKETRKTKSTDDENNKKMKRKKNQIATKTNVWFGPVIQAFWLFELVPWAKQSMIGRRSIAYRFIARVHITWESKCGGTWMVLCPLNFVVVISCKWINEIKKRRKTEASHITYKRYLQLAQSQTNLYTLSVYIWFFNGDF